jgi:hypothetical protein
MDPVHQFAMTYYLFRTEQALNKHVEVRSIKTCNCPLRTIHCNCIISAQCAEIGLHWSAKSQTRNSVGDTEQLNETPLNHRG